MSGAGIDGADMRPLVVSDMDGTLTTAETWRAVLAWLDAHHPSPAAHRFVAVRLPLVILAKAGLYDKERFRARWLADLAALLRGRTAAELAAMGEWVVERHLWPARREAAIEAVAAALPAALAAGGVTGRAGQPAAVILATGAYQPVADAFARRIDAGHAIGTPLELRDGLATGRLAAPVGSGAQKAAAVVAQAGGGAVLAAFGDTAADIPLLELADRPVAVAPDARLLRIARERRWEVLG